MGSEFAQIDDILNARSIAIVGASNSPMKIGSMLTASQLTMGFAGTIYLVNPNEEEIQGHKAYPDLLSLPKPPELVYIVIPADRSLEVLQHCGQVGVKGVVMIPSGFREAGDEGEALEREALRLARQGGFRIIGPNCFGIYNPRNRLTLLPGPDFSTSPGDVAFLAQSGGLASHVARLGRSLGIHFSAIVSYGNGVDIDETALLRYFGQDPQTGVIGAYLEGVRDGRGFLEALKEVASQKPVVMWKVGKAESSRQAVMSHTGSLAGSAEIWEAAFRQTGVIQASGIDEVCDVLVALRHLGRRPGRRILVSGGGGGLGTNAADLAGLAGLDIPPPDRGDRTESEQDPGKGRSRDLEPPGHRHSIDPSTHVRSHHAGGSGQSHYGCADLRPGHELCHANGWRRGPASGRRCSDSDPKRKRETCHRGPLFPGQ